jgi:DAK2 domain fusion protein YloV
MGLVLNAEAFRAWTRLCVDALAEARAEIDALNVFPVPDSDTGTNAYLTFVAGADAVAQADADIDLGVLLKVYVDALLTGARGNCGVICSQLVRASLANLPVSAEIDGVRVAAAFERATEASYAAVGDPKEGTILSVASAASVGARAAAGAGKSARQVIIAAAAAARLGLERTPSQMELLARAGVVDAGGRALVVVLDATEQALTGRVPDKRPALVPVPLVDPGDDLVEGGPSYEVMYLLEAEDDSVVALRPALAALGDSLVVVGGEGLWNVHVHVDDVGAALEAGMAAGRPYRIRVTHFADQIARQRTGSGRKVIAATTGEGITALVRGTGAEALPFTRDQPLSTQAMLAAIVDSRAQEVIVLPNNSRYRKLFEASAAEARRAGTRVAVIPTNAQVQGLAALAVHDPGADFDEDVVAMSSAAASTTHGAITIAAEAGLTSAGPCEPGDILGVVAGDFDVVGRDQVEVSTEVLDRLVTPTSELVTLIVGAGAVPGIVSALQAHLSATRPEVDVDVHDGAQENYPLFIAVE